MRLALILSLLVVLTLVTSVDAQLQCRPRFDGGYNCFDGQGNATTSTPRFDGGYNVYDNRGNSAITKPRPDGGSTTYDKPGQHIQHDAALRRRHHYIRQPRQLLDQRPQCQRRQHDLRQLGPDPEVHAEPERIRDLQLRKFECGESWSKAEDGAEAGGAAVIVVDHEAVA